MGHVQTIRRAPIYRDEDEGFDYAFDPIEDSISIKETPEGFEVRYLVQDSDPMPPDEMDDDNLFLVNYHRSFDVRRDKIIKENDLINWYRQDFDDYKEDPDDENEAGKFPLETDYHIFALSCYIHSGVLLSLRRGNWNPFDQQGWDTSHVGAVLVSREEWPDAEKAQAAAESLVETWNQYLSGDVYGIVKETFDKEKNQVDEDSCWGFYGYKYALEALKTDI